MSWQGWDGKTPNLAQEPTPEPAPPSFHKPRSKKKREPKPFTIEVRYLGRTWSFLGEEWHVLKRYKTAEIRDKALAKLMRVRYRPERTEFRAGEAPHD